MPNNLVEESDVSDVVEYNSPVEKKKKKLAEHDYAKRISPPVLTQINIGINSGCRLV